MHHLQNKENCNLNFKKGTTGTNSEVTEVLELYDKDFKAAIIKMLQ